MNNNPIGVFDSGIGGLSVLNQIIKNIYIMLMQIMYLMD